MQNDFYDRALRYSTTQWYSQWPMNMPAAVGLTPFQPIGQPNHIDKKDLGFLIFYFSLLPIFESTVLFICNLHEWKV